MKKMLALLLLCLSAHASAEMVASMPNQANGKIVLTNEVCKDPVTKEVYDVLRRSYNYGASGTTSEGCWYVEDESVVVVWVNSNGRSKSRYPLENFTMNPKFNRNNSKSYNY